MDAIQRNPDAASRNQGVSGPGAAQEARAAAYRSNAALEADAPEPADSQTTVTLSRQAQEMAARPEPESPSGVSGAERASAEQMSLLNAQLRRTYMGG